MFLEDFYISTKLSFLICGKILSVKLLLISGAFQSEVAP